ncbi:MAG: hypothetical protein HQM09_14760 [Candidatus Riflebacteria bacterium]|nr:hypothetical protein [Candidatus Riflebacteria bacterium]
MTELYKIFADFDNARILMMCLTCIFSCGMLAWVWGDSKRAGIEITHSQWTQIYVFGLLSFLSGVMVLGLLLTPSNSMGLMELMHLKGLLELCTANVQKFVLYVIRLCL